MTNFDKLFPNPFGNQIRKTLDSDLELGYDIASESFPKLFNFNAVENERLRNRGGRPRARIDVSEFSRLWRDGYSYPKLAERFGIGVGTAHAFACRCGLKERPKNEI